jgi:7-keto-8-aminopelargonate synthetase-like enzyme
LWSQTVFFSRWRFCDVAALCELKERYPGIVLYIDDAHGVGAFGENGCGLVEASGCMGKVDVIIGTMSKSFGSTGGFYHQR